MRAAKVAEFDATLSAFSPAIRPVSLSILLAFEITQFYLFTPLSAAGKSIEQLGLPRLSTPDVPAADGRTDLAVFSIERADQIDAEWLIGLIYDPAAFEALQALPIFQTIPAVQAARFKILSGDAAWAIASPDVMTWPITIAALNEVFSGSPA